jgi:hypothetical protein
LREQRAPDSEQAAEEPVDDSGAAEQERRADRGRASQPQQADVSTLPVGPQRDDQGGDDACQDHPGYAEQQDEQLGVDRVLAGGEERGTEVVADQGATGDGGGVVVGPQGRELRRLRGVRREGVVPEAGVQLVHDRRGPDEPAEVGRRHEQHVVRGSARACTGRRSYDLEERVRGPQVDDPVDVDAGTRTHDLHAGAETGGEVGGGLLLQEHS